MRNRRNYYRVLHVQRDAPTELIKSCYRALMYTLKMHPDRGGDHWNAALLNEAYAVLSDADRREEYDRTLKGPTRRAGSHEKYQAIPGSGGSVGATATDDAFCVFCGLPHAAHEEQCSTCSSPLTLSTEWSAQSSGRRAKQRMALDREVCVYEQWPLGLPRSARIRDLSPSGLRLIMTGSIPLHHIVKLRSEVLHAVARVAYCRELPDSENEFVVGVEFFTLQMSETKGVFLSVSG